MLAAVSAGQAQDMKALFASMPDSVAPLLTQVNREDCIDFLASDMQAIVKNRFGKPTELKQLTGDYWLMQTTPQSTQEAKLLTGTDSLKVICLVHTVCAPACDSRIAFYTTDWVPLPASRFLALPAEDRFYLPADSLAAEDRLHARAKADMYLLRASLSADEPTLTFTYTTSDYLSDGDRSALEPYLVRRPLVYRWEGDRFVECAD